MTGVESLLRRAKDEELGKEMKPEALIALNAAVETAAAGFSSVDECLVELERYVSALKELAASVAAYDNAGGNASKRSQIIDKEVNRFCKKAGEEQLDKEMREEGVHALRIAANKIAYRKKYYDSTNDKFIVFPSVCSCLAAYEVYEEAEKHYYDPEDEFPLKYIAALRDIALIEGGTIDNIEEMAAMAMDIESDDEFFSQEIVSGPADVPVLGSSSRQRLIEKEVANFCKRAGEEQLDKEMREEGVKALKIAANKFAYKQKYYDAGADQMLIFPSVSNCLSGHDIYEEAEKYYYDPEDEYPLKYIAA
jgi:hypothetical protein